ncbi:MAG: hypothetical protein AAGD32_08980 [Planctomycetota bacterium]
MSHVTMSCAEPSADRYLADLASVLGAQGVTASGIGGPALAAAADVWSDSVTNAQMGFSAFLRTREVGKYLAEQKHRWDDQKPACHVCCDSWMMNKHFAAAAKERGIPVVYYVAPQAWASREGRVKRLARVADKVACILPFEQEWFRERGVDATFVGHPLFDERHGLPAELPATGDGAVALLPGSRPSTVRRNLPRILEVATAITSNQAGRRFVFPATDATRPMIESALDKRSNTLPGKTFRDALNTPELGTDFEATVTGCTAALTVSGTATLHTAALGVPMIAVYVGNPLLWHTIGKRLIKTRTFTLVNLLHNGDEHLIPEFIPWYGDTAPTTSALRSLLDDEAAREHQRAGFARIVDNLRGTDAAKSVAAIVGHFI